MTDSMARARRALAAAGLAPDAPLERAWSYASETWLGDGFVLRVNSRGDIGRLAREAHLAAHLPAEARHPGVIDHGRAGELEWLLLPRVAGVVLSRVWPDLDGARRERAARELASALRAMHGVSGPDLPRDEDLAPPHVLPLDRMLEQLASVAAAGSIDAEVAREVEAFARARWPAFDGEGVGLVHGDPHLENVLWDGEHVAALIDLDWSRRSWVEVDLEILLAFCRQPFLYVAADYEDLALAGDYAAFPGWLEAEYPAWFAHPRLDDRLALLHVSRALGTLEDGPRRGPLDPDDPRDPRNRLRAALAGT
jgi:hygromycin-B 7''-O-kinase